MRSTIGATWILQLMILFIVLFVGFIILTLNYSKTVKLKNEVVSMVEKYEGLNQSSLQLVNDYLIYSGYQVMGVCTEEDTEGVYGAYSLNTPRLEKAQANEMYYYCVKKYSGANTTSYYQITIFYRFNLPIIGDTSYFSVKGTTSNFQPVDDDIYDKEIGD